MSRSTFRAWVLGSLAILAPAAVGAQAAKAPKDPLAGLDTWIQKGLTKLQGVGLAIAVVKNDSVVYAKGSARRSSASRARSRRGLPRLIVTVTSPTGRPIPQARLAIAELGRYAAADSSGE